jgi:hypothetical protein
MTNRLVKVDRVGTPREAAELERLGADLLTVDLVSDPRFAAADGRVVTLDQALEIAKVLQRATLVPVLDLAGMEPRRTVEVATRLGARNVQPMVRSVPPRLVRDLLSDEGIGIVYGTIEINHDDDPAWIFGDFDDQDDLDAAFFQVDVLPEYEDSWEFLRDRAPEYEDEEFQIADLDDLAGRYPIVAGLDWSPANVHEVLAAVPNLRGLSFTLAGQARFGGVRFFSYEDVLATLRALG